MSEPTLEWYHEQMKTLSFVKDKAVPPYVYAAFGLAGETGEVMEEIKKSIRETDGSFIPENRRQKLLFELGDVLFYISMLAEALGFTLEQVALANVTKLTARNLERGK